MMMLLEKVSHDVQAHEHVERLNTPCTQPAPERVY